MQFKELYSNRHRTAVEEKAKGRRVIGYISNYCPEEIIYAAGMLPVRLRGTTRNLKEVDQSLPSFVCSYLRGCLEEAWQGNYHYLDGIVVPRTCDGARSLFTIWEWRFKPPFTFYLAVPVLTGEGAVDYFAEELRCFKSSLETYAGQEISPGMIREATRLIDEKRKLLNRLYTLRAVETPPLEGSEIFEIVRAGFVLPTDIYNEMLKKLLENLPAPRKRDKARLLVLGCTIENINYLKLVEDLGGIIVADDFSGKKHFLADSEQDEDPLREIARRYLQMVPDPCKIPGEARHNYILDTCKQYNVEGVLILIQKYCDSYLFEVPHLNRLLQTVGIPTLNLEIDDTMENTGQIITRVEAFLEMLS